MKKAFDLWQMAEKSRRADKERRYEMSKLLCFTLGYTIEEHVTGHGKHFIARKVSAEEGSG